MPRYFFNISDDNYFVRDKEGMNLPNQKAAESQAIKSAQTFRSSAPTPLAMVVTDQMAGNCIERRLLDSTRLRRFLFERQKSEKFRRK
jgi:hypothetical protein